MGLYADWLALCEQPRPDAAQQEYWDRYFAAETENYRKILASGQLVYDGTLEELAASFSMEPVVFCGFLDGINTSLTEPLELESLEPETVLQQSRDIIRSTAGRGVILSSGCALGENTKEENIRAIPPVSSLIDQEYTPAEICGRILEGLDPVLLDEFTTEYRCDCSRERVERAVLSLGKAQLDELIEEDHGTEVGCHFCGKLYRFSEEDLKALRDRAAR